MKQYILISCRMIENELNQLMKTEEMPYPVLYIPQALHTYPEKLREYLQELIDRIVNVDAILLAMGNCGGGTVGLRATHCPLILPRAADCIDMLITPDRLSTRKRSSHSIFLTESWIRQMETMDGSYEKMVEEYDEETANEIIQMMYHAYQYWDMIDTKAYDVESAARLWEKQAQIAGLTRRTIDGPCGTLKKLVRLEFDEDFLIVPVGETVKQSDFFGDAFQK